MARERLSMRKTKEILRLKYSAGLSNRQICRSVKVSHTTVSKYLEVTSRQGITWPVDAQQEEVLRTLLEQSKRTEGRPERNLPEMAYVHRELQRKSVTLQLLWEEYRKDHPEGYGYTQFCEYYSRWRSHLDPVLRQHYKAGEKAFVDWAGQTIPIVDRETGTVTHALLFVGVLGASNYTFAEAFENRQLAAWLDAHVHMYEFFGGVPVMTISDNEKTGVNKASRYEPLLNPAYRDLAEHYGTVLLPTRPREPQDKAKVENAVLQAERRILAALRNRTFFSLAELNTAIRELLVSLNNRPFQKLDGTRRSLFEDIDRPALQSLPVTRYEKAEWKKAKVNIDYHVQVDWHNYSVPCKYLHREVEVRLTRRVVEILCQGQRIAAHQRSGKKGGFTTDRSHMPKSHQRHTEWNPGRITRWALKEVGEYTEAVVRHIMESKPHPEIGYRSCMGVMRLSKTYGKVRLEAACKRAWHLKVCSYQSVKSILRGKLDSQPLPQAVEPPPPITHENLRGSRYYR